MAKNVFRVLLAFAFCFVAAPASAAPIPLVEFNWQQADFENGPLPATVAFSFTAGADFLPLLNWTGQYGPADVGMSFWAPAEIVDDAIAALEGPNVGYALENGPANFVGPLFLFGLDGRPSGPGGECGPNRFCTTRFVPDFENYSVSALERVIDYLVLTEVQAGQHYTIEASQTIRYWGIRIPEPTSGILLLVGFHGLMVTFARHR